MTIRFGTNINHEKNYEQAKRLLVDLFGTSATFSAPEYSRDYNAAPDDPNASIYLNYLCELNPAESCFPSELRNPLALKRELKRLEQIMGRTAQRKAAGIIDADFDLVESED